jgi:hypothetical protein
MLYRMPTKSQHPVVSTQTRSLFRRNFVADAWMNLAAMAKSPSLRTQVEELSNEQPKANPPQRP